MKNCFYLEKTKKIPWMLAKYAFVVVLMLILIDIILGGLLLYKCVVLVKLESLQSDKNPLEFKEDVYKEILEQWKTEEQKLQEKLERNYLNPFSKPLEK